MSEATPTRPLFALLAVLLGTGSALVAAELVLRATSPDRYSVWPPDLELAFPSLPELTPGIVGPVTFSTNGLGIRGPEFDEDDDFRILALGGSTTESLLVDDSETWTHLLERVLEREFPGARVWVGNAGRSGHSARDHALQAEKLLPQYPKIDIVLLLVGINDLMIRLRRGDGFVAFRSAPPEYLDGLLTHAFWGIPVSGRTDYPFYKRTELWSLVRRAVGRLEPPPPGPNQSGGPAYLTGQRAQRSRAGRIDSLPGLGTALEDYRWTLERIVTTLLDQDIRPVLITQPTMWRADLPDDLEALLWFGRARDFGEDVFYTAGALDEAMQRYNGVVLGVCRDREIVCVDLAARLPKDTTVFYDDVHFNEAGSRRVAEVLAEALTVQPDIRTRLER